MTTFLDRLKKPHILILHQESRARINQSELAKRLELEEKGCKVTTLHVGHGEYALVTHGKDVYLEAKGTEVNLSKVQMFMKDKKFMDLVYKRMENPKPGMKIEKRRNEETGEDNIWVIYPPIREKVRNFTGSFFMMWDNGINEAIDLMERLERDYKVVPSNSIQSLRNSDSKIITQALFEKHGVPTPKTACFPYDAYDPSAIETALRNLGNPPWYMKADHGSGGATVRRIPDMAHDIEDSIRNMLQTSLNHPWTITVRNTEGMTSQAHTIPDFEYSVREDVKAILGEIGTPPWSVKVTNKDGIASEYEIPAIEFDVKHNIKTALTIAKSFHDEGKEGFLIQQAIPSPAGNRAQRTRVIIQDGKVVGALLWTGQEWSSTDNAYANKDNRTDIKLKSLPEDHLEALTPAQKDAAIAAARAVGLSHGGIDIVGTPENPFVLEANSGPGIWFHAYVGQNTIDEVATGTTQSVNRGLVAQRPERTR